MFVDRKSERGGDGDEQFAFVRKGGIENRSDEGVAAREQLELDSMDFLDIVMELRKRYRVQIPEDDYVELATMQSTVRYLAPLMKDIQKA